MLPFPGGIGATANGLLVFSVVAAILFLFTLRSPPSLKRAIVKTIGILFLAGIAYDQGAPLPLLLALLFASFGDFLLAFDGDRNFQLGLGGFLLAQVALVVLFLSDGSSTALWSVEPWRIVLALLVLAHSVRLAIILWRKLPRAMGGQIVGYALVITMMGIAALGYATPAVIAAKSRAQREPLGLRFCHSYPNRYRDRLGRWSWRRGWRIYRCSARRDCRRRWAQRSWIKLRIEINIDQH